MLLSRRQVLAASVAGVALKPENPLVGGVFLRRAAIRSPNFVTGVSGWTINQDGSAEFNNGTFRGVVDVGVSPNPQVIVDATVNYAIKTKMVTGGAAASDVTSFANIQAAIRFPSNNAAELSSPLIAETLITYTDASIADALLMLSGFTGSVGTGAAFTLMISASSTGSKSPSVIQGTYTFSGSTITLTPETAITSSGALLCYNNPALAEATQGDAKLLPASEGWRSLGALGAHYTVNLGRYRIRPDNTVDIDFNVTGDGLQAGTVSFANAIVAQPFSNAHTALPLGSTRAVTATDVWPRWSVSAAGVVSVTVTPVAGIIYAACARIPMD